MKYLKVKSVSAIDDNPLLVEFDNAEKKKYDITSLLSIDMFSPLKDVALFGSSLNLMVTLVSNYLNR
ncbi:MAG: DUF2442 domain-containing protein [Chlorobaculum sp.]|jgi:hypothetical protein|nr:DUF2442 domain-containing protein [Chlorobaculum sp.]